MVSILLPNLCMIASLRSSDIMDSALNSGLLDETFVRSTNMISECKQLCVTYDALIASYVKPMKYEI